jgi:hypothetical protein
VITSGFLCHVTVEGLVCIDAINTILLVKAFDISPSSIVQTRQTLSQRPQTIKKDPGLNS